MNDYSHFAAEEDAIIDANSSVSNDDWRLLRRLKLPPALNDGDGSPTRRAMFLDVEATGLKIGTDEVIELAMLPFDYEPDTGRITTIHHDAAFNALRDPGFPIPPDATFVNGITDSDVAGQSIDADAVTSLVNSVSLVIAHNASYDRPMVEALWPVFEDVAWACTLREIDWRAEGFPGQSLEFLGMKHGWFFDGHRALVDCEAGVALLGETLPVSGTRVMQSLRESAAAPTWHVPATKAPFEKKDVLKDRGYRWNADAKVWWTQVKELDDELEWLGSEVFGRTPEVDVTKITAKTRYSRNES